MTKIIIVVYVFIFKMSYIVNYGRNYFYNDTNYSEIAGLMIKLKDFTSDKTVMLFQLYKLFKLKNRFSVGASL